MSDQEVISEFLAREQTQMLAEYGKLRDDMRILTAIVTRLDGTMSGMVVEIRSMQGTILPRPSRGTADRGEPTLRQ
jgi:hypothetical protein